MKNSRLVRNAAVILSLALVAGCTTMFKPKENVRPPDYTNVQSAEVYVDGRFKAVTPATVRIRRAFTESEVVLRVNNRPARYFEIERTNSSNRSALDFSFSGTSIDGYRSFNVAELPTVQDTIKVIPFYVEPLQIFDLEYGLTLIIE